MARDIADNLAGKRQNRDVSVGRRGTPTIPEQLEKIRLPEKVKKAAKVASNPQIYSFAAAVSVRHSQSARTMTAKPKNVGYQSQRHGNG